MYANAVPLISTGKLPAHHVTSNQSSSSQHAAQPVGNKPQPTLLHYVMITATTKPPTSAIAITCTTAV
jgi:hypothetical protein